VPNFENVYVVVIDDNLSDIKVIRTLLTQLGIHCDSLNSHDVLSGAIDQITSIPDVIFLDLEMPGINGYEVLAMLLTIPDFARVPVVAYSAYSAEMSRAREAGFHSFLGKPLISATFAEQVARILNDEPVWEVR
jgi:CheY-like chemotaxis protein